MASPNDRVKVDEVDSIEPLGIEHLFIEDLPPTASDELNLGSKGILIFNLLGRARGVFGGALDMACLETFRTVVGNYTVNIGDDNCVILAWAQNGPFTISIPTAESSPGRILIISKTDTTANLVTVTPASGTFTNKFLSGLLRYPGDTVYLMSDGISWLVLASNGTVDRSYCFPFIDTTGYTGLQLVSIFTIPWNIEGYVAAIGVTAEVSAVGDGIFTLGLNDSVAIGFTNLYVSSIGGIGTYTDMVILDPTDSESQIPAIGAGNNLELLYVTAIGGPTITSIEGWIDIVPR